MIWRIIAFMLVISNVASAQQADFVLKREGWSFDRSQLNWYGDAQPEKLKAAGELKSVAGWTEYDFDIPEDGWYGLWERGWNPEWTRTISLDGEKIFWHAVSAPEDVDKASNSFKEANLWLTKGRHTIRFQRVTWPGDLPDAWELRAAHGDPAGSIRAVVAENVVRVGARTPVKLLGGTRAPTRYELVLRDAENGEIFPVGTVDFPASERPVERSLDLIMPRQGTFYLQAKVDGRLLRPGDLKAGLFVAVDTKNAAVPPEELVTKRIVEIDCAAEPIPGAFFEKDGKTRVVETPFGRYRESSGLGKGGDGYWGTDGFSYKIKLPETEKLYRLRVEYPDDDRRSMGFWINDGSEPKSNAAAIVNTGGVETGDQYSLTRKMQVHESFFYPQGQDDVVVAVVNLVPNLKAAASRITIDLVESGLPAAPLGATRGREIGYYFEESGRWRKFFGGDSKRGITEDMKSLDRWGQWNRYFGANLMFPTINVYQANHYPSHILDGYFSRPINEVRLAALIGEKYQQKFVPELHLTGQDWFDREVMGVWEEKGLFGPVIKFARPDVEDTIIRDRDGNTKYAYEPFVYNALHPRVQEMYISILGELADSLADCESFDGISSRMMFTWQWQGWNALPNLNWGYDDWTIGQFEKETGIKVPGEAGSPNRFRDRYNFLIGTEKKRWVEWRCAKIFSYHQKMLARIRQAKPDAKLVFNWFPLDERHALSTDMLEQMEEVGMDWHQYAKEKDILVIPPGGTYGRRYSIPTSDASKVDGVYDKAIQTVGRFDGRAYGFYSDYYEVNKNMNWADLGGKPFPAFDAGLPSGLHERGMYAQAMADCDSGFISNGGSGWIFGTPSILQGFMREYRSLPDVPFEPWEKARDPVAVWSHRDTDGTFWFYVVNRLPVSVRVSLGLKAGGIFSAPGGEKVDRQSDGRLALTMEPYMLSAFRADPGVSLEDITVDVPQDFVDGLKGLMAFAKKIRMQLASREVAPELTKAQTQEALDCFDGALSAFERGEYFSARGLLERLAAVQVYYLSGEFPPGLWERSQNHGAPSLDAPREVIYELDSRKGGGGAIAGMEFDKEGNLWTTASDALVAFDMEGKMVRRLPLFEPYALVAGDIRKSTLAPARPLAPASLTLAPDGAFLVQSGDGLPLRFDSVTGRLIDMPNKAFLVPGLPLSVLAITPANETIVSTTAAGNTGVFLYRPDGTLLRKLSHQASGAGAADASGRIYLARPDGVEILETERSQRIAARAFSALEVSPDGSVLLGLDAKTNMIYRFRRAPDGAFSAAGEFMLPAPAAAIALAGDGKLAVGFRSPDHGVNVRLYSLETGSLVPVRDLVRADSEAFEGEGRLKAFDGNLYFAEAGKLMRLIPGAPDKLEVAYDPGFRADKPTFESFAFAPNGDLYLTSNWNGKLRGINAYVCRRQEGGWAKPEQLNHGIPLWEGGNIIARDIEVDAQNRLLLRLRNDAARNGQNVSIYRWSQDAGKELLIDLGDVVPEGEMGMVRDTNGDILIAGGSARKVARLAPDGKVIWMTERLKSSPPGYTDLRYPVAIAADRDGGAWVTDPARSQILRLDAQGKLESAIGSFGDGHDPHHLTLNRPSGIAVVKGADGREWLYVADNGNRRIVKWPLN